MMNHQALKAVLTEVANPEIAKHSQRYFKSGKGEYGAGDVFLGIRIPVLREQSKARYSISIGRF